MMQRKRSMGRALLLVSLLMLTPTLAQAQGGIQDYRLGIGDVLQLNVPQQTDLNEDLTIRADGTAIIGLVGAVPLAGLSLLEAEDLVRQRLRLFDPNIGDVSLSITEFNALRVFVLGAVVTPGSHTFNESPTLWEAIRAAGGPTATANLSVVRYVHQQGSVARTQTFDLSTILTGVGDLPDIRLGSGDTIVIPVSDGQIVVPPEVGVQIFGSVASPGTVPISEPTRLVTMLMLAGAPTDASKLLFRGRDEGWQNESEHTVFIVRVGRRACCWLCRFTGRRALFKGRVC